MKHKFRYWILILICGGILCWGLLDQKQAISLNSDVEILHILNRLSFGPIPGQIEEVKAKGIEVYIQTQLAPESISESSLLESHLAKLETISKSPVELFQQYSFPAQVQKGERLTEEKQEKLKKARKKVRQEAIEAHLARAIASNRQLQEVMVDFWFNHFNVYDKKDVTDLWVADYENEIRSHVLGKFRDLLAVTAHHPAMLWYLDNRLNTDPNSPAAKGIFDGLNENYARELMELHTLGVDGGYTQADVIALAKILTGWGIDTKGNLAEDENGFFFFQKRHDPTDKVFLGKTIKGGGIEEGEQALDILASHPSTAHFISYKLAQYFLADEPPTSLVDKLADKFQETDGDIRAVVDTLVHSTEFNEPQYYAKKFKNPYQYVLSVVRAAKIENPKYKQLAGMLRQLSMPVYGCVTPDGYKNTEDAWLNSDAMMRRISLATAIANGTLNKQQIVDAETLSATLGNNFSTNTKETIKDSPRKLRAALILGSPEMMYR
jgi:uncharacterized protein (DUF1800 family)